MLKEVICIVVILAAFVTADDQMYTIGKCTFDDDIIIENGQYRKPNRQEKAIIEAYDDQVEMWEKMYGRYMYGTYRGQNMNQNNQNQNQYQQQQQQQNGNFQQQPPTPPCVCSPENC